MAKMTGTVSKPSTAPSGEINFIAFDASAKKITIGVFLAGVGPDSIEMTGAQARAFMNVAISGVTLGAVLNRAVKLAYEQKYSITATVAPGDSVDDAY